MYKRCIAAFCLLSALHTSAQTLTGFSYPESIIADRKYLYVTNIGEGGNPAAADSNGYISKLTLDGKIIAKKWTNEKLNAPKGTAIIKDILYVADLDRIVCISVNTGKKVKEIRLDRYGTSFLNDLAVKNDTTVFVSATDIGQIFQIDLLTEKVESIAKLPGANGVYYDRKKSRLFGCGFVSDDFTKGEIIEVTWAKHTPVVRKVGHFRGAFDGITLLDDQTLLVSNWVTSNYPAGYLEIINLQDNSSKKLNLPLMYGPADLYLHRSIKRLYIPVVMDGTIRIVSEKKILTVSKPI